MSDPRSKCYTLEQRAYVVEQYFRTSSYKIALGRFKKKFKEMPDPKMIQRAVERFQTAYTLEDERRHGRPHTLSDDDRTELREHMEGHPGTSAHRTAQQLGHKHETVRKTSKEEGFSLPNISVAQIKTSRLLSTLRLLRLVLHQIWPKCRNNVKDFFFR